MRGRFEKRHQPLTLGKALTLLVALVLVVTMTVAGTLAWLSDKTSEVTNTFTSAKFIADDGSFTLWEHEAVDEDGDGVYTLNNSEEVQGNTYKILPGVNIPKDPTVDIVGLQEHVYLYIKVTGSIPGTVYYIDSSNWEKLDGYTDIYVYCGDKADNNVIKPVDDAHKTFTVNILTQNENDGVTTAITVPSNYMETTGGTLTFTAYMAQVAGTGTPSQAWELTYPGVGTKTATPATENP